MPSPLGHGLAGAVVHVVTARGGPELRDRTRIAAIVGAALAPDVDLSFFLLDGRNHHNHETHSIGAAALVFGLAWLLGRTRRWPRAGPLALAVGAAWLSHVALDYLNVDTTPPIGIMALWPLDDGFHKCPWPIFLDIGRTLSWATVWHDTLAAAWEAAVLTPLLFWVWQLRRHARN
jgi:membrane-bound metal-dependent hydrolase YbcI (DUF457 family)